MNHQDHGKPISNAAKAIGRPAEGEGEAEEIEQVSQDSRFVLENSYFKCLIIPLF